MPLVSVIIPTFNRSALVVRAINSVLAQTFKDFEILVIDDGSTDDTEFVLKNNYQNKEILYFYQDNQGVAAARNKGSALAKGQWLAFLDSDDEWLPEKLAKQITFAKENPHFKWLYTLEHWVRNGTKVNLSKHHTKYGGDVLRACMGQCFIGPSTVMINKDFFEAHGGFLTNYPVCEDYDLWLRLAVHNEVGLVPEKLIIKYGGHSDQLSTAFHSMDWWRLKSLVRLFNERKLDADTTNFLKDLIYRKKKILELGYIKRNKQDALDELNLLCQLD